MNVSMFDSIYADGETKRYHVVKTEHGFNKLLPLPTFKDSRNGYLVQDCCAFGAEVYVIESTGLGQEFSLVKDPRNGSYSWMIHRFSTLRNRYYYSNVFNAAGYKWQLMLNPKGDSGETNRSLSLYLKLDGDQSVYAEANLSVKDQLGGVDHMYKVCKLFGAWGTPRFMLLSDLRDASKGYLVNDILVVEAKLTQVSSVKDFS
ncbi:ubiquitin C-terminal hydrolase 12-like [Euphorbia lathyris]|uniref:ubiquitin C-terminal hydrolase 12-like n=1 Tax=Euphorbia lathyris TaxID=212925 RepID=UPI003313789A